MLVSVRRLFETNLPTSTVMKLRNWTPAGVNCCCNWAATPANYPLLPLIELRIRGCIAVLLWAERRLLGEFLAELAFAAKSTAILVFLMRGKVLMEF